MGVNAPAKEDLYDGSENGLVRSFRQRGSRLGHCRLALFVAALLALIGVGEARATAVTLWTDQADALGEGNANWHSLAIMHMAMHDAMNAVRPIYARWEPRTRDEPDGTGADAQAAVETAGATVLMALHPTHRALLEGLLNDRLALLPAGAARDRGRAVGAAVGTAAVERRRNDGFTQIHLFPASDVPGAWRPTPPRFQASARTMTRPFLFADTSQPAMRPPPTLGSPQYLADVASVRRLGGEHSPDRTPAQTEAAIFWAYQSTQRGYIHLAATLIDAREGRLSLPEQARLMSLFATSMADSAILIWAAKEHWSYWRPVDAIRSGAFGVVPDRAWSSFIETPQHPEYPAGHSSDCFTGAGLIKELLLRGDPVTYTAQSAAASPARPAQVWSTDMGEPPAPVELTPLPRSFRTVDEAASECAESRIWAGAHFAAANEESRRIAQQIIARALAAVPPLN